MNSDVRIIVLGNYSPSGHDASRIVDENGVAPTVKENHGTVTAVAMEVSNKIMIDEAPKKLFNIYPKVDKLEMSMMRIAAHLACRDLEQVAAERR